jgi:hypothetical protein
MASISIIFPELQDLIEAGYEVTMKIGYRLKFRVNVEELTEDHWAQKIEDHQKVCQLSHYHHASRLTKTGVSGTAGCPRLTVQRYASLTRKYVCMHGVRMI